jgi:hypothetical protein
VKFEIIILDNSSNIGAVRPPFWGRRRAGFLGRRRGGGVRRRSEVVEGGGVRRSGAEADRSGFLGRRKGSASLKIQGGASSLAHVRSLNKDGQNLLTTHFFASPHACDTIEGLKLAYYE